MPSSASVCMVIYISLSHLVLIGTWILTVKKLCCHYPWGWNFLGSHFAKLHPNTTDDNDHDKHTVVTINVWTSVFADIYWECLLSAIAVEILLWVCVYQRTRWFFNWNINFFCFLCTLRPPINFFHRPTFLLVYYRTTCKKDHANDRRLCRCVLQTSWENLRLPSAGHTWKYSYSSPKRFLAPLTDIW